MQATSTANLEIVVLGLDILRLDVLGDDLIRYVTCRGYEIASRPEMSAPELLTQSPEVAKQLERGLSFDGLHQATRRQGRRNAQQKMNVIGTNMPLQDLNVVVMTDSPDQVARPNGDVPSKDRLAVLGDKHDVVVQHVDAVRPLAIFAHSNIVPQAP